MKPASSLRRRRHHAIIPLSAASLLFWAALSSCAPPERPQADGSTDDGLSGEADLPAPTASPSPAEADDESLRPVTRERGIAVVRVGRLEAESAQKPWSGWWYPAQSRELFESEDGRSGEAPLEKFDRWSAHEGDSRESAVLERDNLYRKTAFPWEGLCDAWALASLMEPEPAGTIVRRGIRFSVGDQKALLTKLWEQADGKRIYGRPFRDDVESRREDLLPDEFHRFLQTELFEASRPFIFDKDPGVAIWNTPVWKASVDVSRDPELPESAVRVETVLLGADPWVENRDDVGTRSIQFHYLYRLEGNWEGEELHVTGGRWLSGKVHGLSVDSLADHPDYVVSIPANGLPHSSRNDELDGELVRRLIEGAEAP